MQDEIRNAKSIMRSAGLGHTLVSIVGGLGVFGMIVAVIALFARIGHEHEEAFAALLWFAALFVATAYAFGLAAVISLLRGIFRIQFRDYVAKQSSGTTPS